MSDDSVFRLPSSVFLIVISWLFLSTSEANAQAPTLTTTTLPGVIQTGGTTAFFGAYGTYNIGGFGPMDKVTLEVKQTDADGTSNEVNYAEVLGTGGSPPASGNYNGGKIISYTSGKRYFIKSRLYNTSGSVKASGWIEIIPH